MTAPDKKKSVEHNYLPGLYDATNPIPINHNYLRQQFADYSLILKKFERLAIDGDFTLGRAVDEFESRISGIVGAKYTVGVGSGTDALLLSLKALGVDKGDEVITTPYTFVATVGAIVTAGARPIFVDIGDDYNINPKLIEQAITTRTKAILPVHWSGLVCDMDPILEIARRRNIAVVEDACHAIKASYKGKKAGTFGDTGCFSLHPLKNLNVWGDGGYLVTNSEALHEKLVLLRNHGLRNRNECEVFAYNSRLDTLQAIVANHLLDKLDGITRERQNNARFLDEELGVISEIKIPKRPAEREQVFHLYCIRTDPAVREQLVQFLNSRGIDAKVHYPIPMHLQPAAREFGYTRGDFPVAEAVCSSVFSLPVHEYISLGNCEEMVRAIKDFFGRSSR